MEDIEVYALETFPWSRNGIKIETAEVHSTFPLPASLFDGLNAAGKVRRVDIGDGHVSLHAVAVATEPVATEPAIVAPPASAHAVAPASPVAEPAAVPAVEPASESAVAAANTSAPQPPIKTIELTEAEQASINDGSWRVLKFFAKRSIAAKVSDEPIRNGEDADAAIELFIESQAK